MQRRSICTGSVVAVIALGSLGLTGWAAGQSRSSASYSVDSETLSSGVGESSSPSYSGTSSSGLPPPTTQESPEYAATPELAGQLAVPQGFALAGLARVNEVDTARFRPATALDDGTFQALPLENSVFELITPTSLAVIDPVTGVVTTEAVLEDQALTVRIQRGAAEATKSFVLVNSIRDNYGLYAADGLEDGWQVFHFGLENADAGPMIDFDRDGLSNLAEYALGLHPREPGVFRPTPSRSGSSLEFRYQRSSDAAALGTQFVVKWSDSLIGMSWSDAGVSQVVESDDGTLQTVKALIPAGTFGRRFARLEINQP